MSGELGKASLELEADLGNFERNVGTADVTADKLRDTLAAVARIANIAEAALNDVKLDASNAATTRISAAQILDGVSGISDEARVAAGELDRVRLSESQAATSALSASQIVAALDSISAAAADARHSIEGVGAADATTGLLALAGFGHGARVRVPGTGVRVGGLAFGSVLGLAGFGLEHVITSVLGTLGSLVGGLVGGGLLGLGVLGTSAVGMGTDLAGIGQAAGDIKNVSSALGNLQTAISVYGKHSQEAAVAQAQLNATLHGFSPVAQSAVLNAAKTSQGFKKMFDQVSGEAEKTGAQIINQAMHVGEAYLPTIGRFAAENMGIIQKQLQPLFAWLKNPTFTKPGFGGGLGIFTNLEEIFQRNLPTAVHAGSQAFEFFIRTVDVAAQQTGHFMQRIDAFFTKENQAGPFGRWASEVDKLIGLFRSWLGLFTSLAGAAFALFKPAVGFGQALAIELTKIVDQVKAWLQLSSTQSVLHNLFNVHLVEVIKGIGGVIQSLLPLVEAATIAFMKMETVLAAIAGGVLKTIANVIGQITRYHFADTVLGWAAAFGLIYKVNSALWTRMTGGAAASADSLAGVTAAANETTAAVERLNASLLGMGPAAERGALAADAAIGTEGAAAGGAGFLGLSGVGAGLKSGLMGALPFALGGLLAGAALKSMIGGHTGSVLGNAATFAGIGAGIGSIIPGVGTLAGGGIGALVGAVGTLIHYGPSFSDQMDKMSRSVQLLGRESSVAAGEGHNLLAEEFSDRQQKQINSMAGVMDSLTAAIKRAITPTKQFRDWQDKTAQAMIDNATGAKHTAAAIDKQTAAVRQADTVQAKFISEMDQMAQSAGSAHPRLEAVYTTLRRIAQQIGHIPNRKTIRLVLDVIEKGNVAALAFAMDPMTAERQAGDRLNRQFYRTHGRGPAHIELNLPQKIQMQIAKAEAGHGSLKAAYKAAYDFYARQLRQKGLTRHQRMELYQAEAEYYQPGDTNYNVPGVPPVSSGTGTGTTHHHLSAAQREALKLQHALLAAEIAVAKAQQGSKAWDKAIAAEERALKAEIKFWDQRAHDMNLSLKMRDAALKKELAYERQLKALQKQQAQMRSANEAQFLSEFAAIQNTFAPNATPDAGPTNTHLHNITQATRETAHHLKHMRRKHRHEHTRSSHHAAMAVGG